MDSLRYKLLAAAIVLSATTLEARYAHANAPAAAASQESTWMPDVAERIASLRERAERAEEEAAAATAAEAGNGQYWRSVTVPSHTDGRP